jgi:DNA sulfur modification protein DndB
MIENILPRDQLRALCRRKFKGTESRTVDQAVADALAQEGWQKIRTNKHSIKLERAKPHDKELEDRVWSLFYRMGFPFLAAEGGASLTTHTENDKALSNQIDCVALDDEIALAAECKSSKEFSRRPRLQEEIAKLGTLRQSFSRAVQGFTNDSRKRVTITCLFLRNAQLGEIDIARAKEANVVLFDDKDLNYYEELVRHLGSAARYQFLADLLPGKEIPGLKIRLPAIKLRIGGGDAYMFAISPEFLLKISYISHRQKGKGSDIDTYQRMMKRSRLRTIREFIEEQGVFPTNIVLNIESRMLRFDRTTQEGEGAGDTESGVLGWLHIRATYKAAWIIDGQHRLFGYSGSTKAARSRLAVLAFSGLKPGDQAGMFISINSKQKSVKQSLLQELYAELHWEAEDEALRVRAIISKVIQSLNEDKASPFYGRIQTADDGRDEKRCISLTSMFSALDKSELYIAGEKGGQVVEYGPLWHPDGHAALRRTASVVNCWFKTTTSSVVDWWDIGAGEGGGLAMNDGVVALLGVLRSVLLFLGREHHLKLVTLSDQELAHSLEPYAKAISGYLASLSAADRQAFRGHRGVQGVTTRQRRMQQAIKLTFSKYNPPGLEDFLRNEKAETNKQARELLDDVELILKATIIEDLKEELGKEEAGWWFNGVPPQVRKDVMDRRDQDEAKRGGMEHYFNLIQYRAIITHNWGLFGSLLGYGKNNVGKEKGTEWIRELNEFRNAVMHASSGVHIAVEDLDKIKGYHGWLKTRIENPEPQGDDSLPAGVKDE